MQRSVGKCLDKTVETAKMFKEESFYREPRKISERGIKSEKNGNHFEKLRTE